MSDRLISIGELARRTGVAVTALRYYDELGLVRPQTRSSGQRRYDESAVRAVGVVIFVGTRPRNQPKDGPRNARPGKRWCPPTEASRPLSRPPGAPRRRTRPPDQQAEVMRGIVPLRRWRLVA